MAKQDILINQSFSCISSCFSLQISPAEVNLSITSALVFIEKQNLNCWRAFFFHFTAFLWSFCCNESSSFSSILHCGLKSTSKAVCVCVCVCGVQTSWVTRERWPGRDHISKGNIGSIISADLWTFIQPCLTCDLSAAWRRYLCELVCRVPDKVCGNIR